MAAFHVDSSISGALLAELEQNIINIFGTPGKAKDPDKTLSNIINAVKKSNHNTMTKLCK